MGDTTGLTIAYESDRSLVDSCGLSMRFVRGTIAFDSSYPTNGEAWDLSKIFPTEVQAVFIENKSGYIFEYDKTNKKLKAFYFDYDAGADGPAIEVANDVDLEALTGIGFLAIGY